MALTVGTNSWVTVAEADAYFADHFGRSAWAGLANSVKEQLLISAYRWIQQQAIFSISPTSTADAVKQAQYETAWYIYKYFDNHEDRRALITQGVKRFQISKFEEELEEAGFPKFIKDILKDSLVGRSRFPLVSRTFE